MRHCQECSLKAKVTSRIWATCARCQTPRYCSKACQIKHWVVHKAECHVKCRGWRWRSGQIYRCAKPVVSLDSVNMHPHKVKNLQRFAHKVQYCAGHLNADLLCRHHLQNIYPELVCDLIGLVADFLGPSIMRYESDTSAAHFKTWMQTPYRKDPRYLCRDFISSQIQLLPKNSHFPGM